MNVYRIEFYVPEKYLDKVKNAVFKAGAGKMGSYDCVSWETLGGGQFRPLKGSNPFFGSENSIEKVKEYKVELICEEIYLNDAIAAIKLSHPYEVPSFQYWKVNVN